MTQVRAPRLLAGMLGLAISTGLSSGSVPARAETAHPEQWPRAASPESLTDARTEAFVTELMEGLSLEEKVGQVIQADISAITPEDLRDYPLGSILAGGNSAPGGNDRASPAEWLALTDAFRAVAAERRPGHTPIPPILGVDAVHGHNNIVGATIFPHNIGLGAARDPDLVRRIGAGHGRGGGGHRLRLDLRADPGRPPRRPLGPHLRGLRRDPGDRGLLRRHRWSRACRAGSRAGGRSPPAGSPPPPSTSWPTAAPPTAPTRATPRSARRS